MIALSLRSATVVAAGNENNISFDLFIFSQEDGGGNPYDTEEFVNWGGRVEYRVEASKQIVVRHNLTLAVIDNRRQSDAPDSVNNATLTSASGRIIYGDTALGIDWKPPGGKWTISPGIYYHHQDTFIGGGPDFQVQRHLAGGDTTLLLSYGLRVIARKLRYWDGSKETEYEHFVPSHTVLVGWTQTLSSSWLASLSAAYARQDGVLGSTLNFVALHDAVGTPIYFVDEMLPLVRNRVQMNARARWSPSVATALGVSVGYYLDDWGVRNYAAEPSFSIPLWYGLRLRAWYRVALQTASHYFREEPTAVERYQTQDSDLASFALHSPGLELMVPMRYGAASDWFLRAAAFGFYRDDGISAVGGHTGVLAEW